LRQVEAVPDDEHVGYAEPDVVQRQRVRSIHLLLQQSRDAKRSGIPGNEELLDGVNGEAVSTISSTSSTSLPCSEVLMSCSIRISPDETVSSP
jgi:hypothetical protein